MSKIIFLILGIIIGGFFVVFVLQNMVTVDVILLGYTVSTSRALMVLIVLGFGIVLGLIIKSLISLRKFSKNVDMKE